MENLRGDAITVQLIIAGMTQSDCKKKLLEKKEPKLPEIVKTVSQFQQQLSIMSTAPKFSEAAIAEETDEAGGGK